MAYQIIGNVLVARGGVEVEAEETVLADCTDLATAWRWLDRYTAAGDYGGYDYIEIVAPGGWVERTAIAPVSALEVA